MTLPPRPDPRGKPVTLFATCMVDMIYPQTGMAVVDLLTHLGITVDFPMAQTCCAQPAFNAGHHHEARQVAQQFLRAFRHAEVIVAPSGSCSAMIRHEYPALFADDPEWGALAERIASITWEITEFIVDGLGISDLGLSLPEPQRFAFHDACHGLRLLGLKSAGRQLIASLDNAEIVEMRDADVCCGFGGLFSVKMPDVSATMLDKKRASIEASSADTILTGDVSCLTQMNGGLSRHQSARRVRHIVDVLADALKATHDAQ